MKTAAKARLVIFGSSDRQIDELLRDSGAQVVSQPLDDLPAIAVPGAHVPDAVIIDLRGRDTLPAALAILKRQHPSVGVVIVAPALDPALMLEAMRAGVTEWIPDPVTAPALNAAIQRVTVHRATGTAGGEVFGFIGAKGGVGTTTVAVNVAAALSKVVPRQALLVDLHLTNGDAALFLGADARFTTADVLENIHRLDEAYLRGVVTTSKAGLHLLPSSERSVPSTASADRVRDLIAFAAQHYRYLVLDVPRSDMTMLDSLDIATSIIIVANQELATVRRAGTLALTLRQRYGKDRVGIVINRFDRSADIAREDVERVTGGAVRHVIPSDYRAALDGLNKGQPVVTENHSRLAGSFSALAHLLAGVEKARPAKEERPASLLGRFGMVRS